MSEPIRMYQVQPCVVCGWTTRQGYTSLTYDYGDVKIVVNGVPAAICEQCGEEYVPGEFGVWLGDRIPEIVEEIRARERLEIIKPVSITGQINQDKLAQSGHRLDWSLAGG